jgi:ABC-type sulfate/molybdate transport systems ATPase subunit
MRLAIGAGACSWCRPAAHRAQRPVVTVGDRLAVTGPSGSGKSTLLHLLAGLEHPTAGAIEWPSGRTGIGVVFQGPSLLPTLDVTENVALPLLLAGDPHREASTRARQALDRLDIANLAAALPATLSGGQAQRVAIARMLGRPAAVDPRRRTHRPTRPAHRRPRHGRAAGHRRRGGRRARGRHARPGHR